MEQAPQPSLKIGLWAYHVEPVLGADKKKVMDKGIAIQRHGRTHIWTVGETGRLSDADCSSLQQTRNIFSRYQSQLDLYSATLNDNAVRTWLFVRDIDRNYAGLVAARRDFFSQNGLTEKTHYIASTGIEGRHLDPEVLVSMDAYAIAGLNPAQVRFLKAPDHICSTNRYGVTFERGVSVDYGDRRHVFISGTASIDNEGNVSHLGDPGRQLRQISTNISALLSDAQATDEDIAQLIVYVRDAADAGAAQRHIDRRYPGTPGMVVQAPVCRPQWLAEIECLAIKKISDNRFAPY